MGLGKLRLRHCSKFYLFFDGGGRLLSSKWVGSASATGYYELIECSLGRKVTVHHREQVEWSDFEAHMRSWIDSHSGFVFDRGSVFDLVWRFFVFRNDRYLAINYDPLTVYSTLDMNNPSRRSVAAGMIEEIVAKPGDAGQFWNSKATEIISNYAHWFAD